MSSLPQGWEEKELSEFINFNPRESIKKGTITKSIPMACLTEFCKSITEYEEKEFKGGTKFRNGDTLLARITPCLENGKTAFVDFLDEDEIAFGSTEYIVLREKEKVSNKDFIYYLSISPQFREIAIKSMTGSSGRQRVQNDVLFREKFILPNDINEQKRIADILSAFDDKIELNNQMNQTLESMATSLFKEWFENFNFPNDKGKAYKENDGEFKSSELGEIPVDWKVKSLDEIADFLNGLAMQKYRPKDEDNYYHVLKIKELNNGISENSDKCCISIPEKYIIKNGDLIFSWSGTLEVKFWTKGKVGLNQHLFKVTSNTYPKWFYYLWNKKYLSIFKHIAKTKATTMGHIKRKNLSESKVLIPNEDVLNHMHSIFEPIIDNIISNSVSTQTLKKQRDTLLLKLMSGEIRV